ncbi:hypothetical protein ACHAW6_000011 [Cyclotella cf. meneghiniana]
MMHQMQSVLLLSTRAYLAQTALMMCQ